MKTACIVVSKRSEEEYCTLSAITRPKMVNGVSIWKIHYFIQWCKCLQVAWKSQQPVGLNYSKAPICFHQSIHGIYSQYPVWVQFVYILWSWNLIRTFMKLRTSLKMGHVWSKPRSLGQILEKPSLYFRDQIIMKLGQSVCLDESCKCLKIGRVGLGQIIGCNLNPCS